jgi:hypothetical protein
VNGRVIVYFQLKVVEGYYCLLVCGESMIGFLVNARGVTVGRFFVLKCDVKDTQNDTEEQFNQLSLEERGKFDEETLVNVNSLRRHVMAGSKGTQFHNEYIVVRSSAPCSYNSCYMQGHLSLSLGLFVLHPIWVIAYLQKVASTVSQVPSLSLLFGVSLHLDANSISAISCPPVPLTRGFSYMAGDNPGGCRRRA